MPNHTSSSGDIVITGVGVTSAIGQGTTDFTTALLNGDHAFSVMRRPGRQVPTGKGHPATPFLGAELAEVAMPPTVRRGVLRAASLSSRVALTTLDEAWHDARLSEVAPDRIGLVVGGSNLQQRELTQLHARYADTPEFLSPTYGMTFMDTDLCGFCTQLYPIRGFAYTLGGASGSGLLAALQAIRAVQSGLVDACVAVGALCDISYWECLAFRAMGAMGSDRYADDASSACRPFDRHRDGFVYGEACGAIVVERDRTRHHHAPYARFLGAGTAVDGNRNPNPSLEGEISVIQAALREAKLNADEIDYVNPHGTGSVIGDEIELQALQHCGLASARINATKSITGHGLTAAGMVEVIATVLQMRERRLHPTRNLSEPIDTSFNWVEKAAVSDPIDTAVSLSIGFGGTSSAICLRRYS
ncbi:hypothetical protein OG225_06725 [Nocardia sp. NBC_01377]|uniref:beta-ketoacyl synthase N-terminal-like domain-containing protein n=1 Tax=Nocardia sp. NBC_01377 TaxID=2903595 RepID=UPI0032498ADB